MNWDLSGGTRTRRVVFVQSRRLVNKVRLAAPAHISFGVARMTAPSCPQAPCIVSDLTQSSSAGLRATLSDSGRLCLSEDPNYHGIFGGTQGDETGALVKECPRPQPLSGCIRV